MWRCPKNPSTWDHQLAIFRSHFYYFTCSFFKTLVDILPFDFYQIDMARDKSRCCAQNCCWTSQNHLFSITLTFSCQTFSRTTWFIWCTNIWYRKKKSISLYPTWPIFPRKNVIITGCRKYILSFPTSKPGKLVSFRFSLNSNII